jgi:hypothetical protein
LLFAQAGRDGAELRARVQNAFRKFPPQFQHALKLSVSRECDEQRIRIRAERRPGGELVPPKFDHPA